MQSVGVDLKALWWRDPASLVEAKVFYERVENIDKNDQT